MKKQILLLLAGVFCLNLSLSAQAGDDRLNEVAGMTKKEGTGWVKSGGLGYDLSGLAIANPRVGAGLNRFGIGGLGTFAANKKSETWYWDNGASLQLGVVRLGRSEDPFTKSIDVLRATSKAGRSITKNKKWYASAILIGQTSILKTYEGNLLKSTAVDGSALPLFSKFLAPAQLQFHPGIEWKPNDHFGLLFSPVGLSLIYVGDDDIAATYVHGNEFGKNNRTQLVPALQANYKNKFLNDRVTYTSSLNLTTNYLDNPFVLTALNFWQNNISIAIFKGLSLDLFGEAAYDHWKLVQKDVNGDKRFDLGTITAPTEKGGLPTAGGPDKLGFGTQWTGSFLLKYNKIF